MLNNEEDKCHALKAGIGGIDTLHPKSEPEKEFDRSQIIKQYLKCLENLGKR